MLWAVRFHDHSDPLALRQQHLQAHIDWLDTHKDVVLIGGSLRDEPGDARPVGGLWIVEAPSRAAVEALLQTDPFWRCGLRERVEIHCWSKAFPDRRVPV